MIEKIRESTTLKFVFASWIVLNYMWISGQVQGSLADYGTAVAAILAVWLGREWKETHYGKD